MPDDAVIEEEFPKRDPAGRELIDPVLGHETRSGAANEQPDRARSDKHRVVVAALIWRIREGFGRPEVLIMKRPPDAPFFPNVWVAPGGGVELGDMDGWADEVCVRALQRELAEELGPEIKVEVRKHDLRAVRAFVRGDGTGVVVLTHVCRWISGDPTVTPEAVEFAWVIENDILGGEYDLIGDTASEIMDAIHWVDPF